MITALCDSYPRLLRRNREIFVAVLICFIYLCALPTTTNVSPITKSNAIRSTPLTNQYIYNTFYMYLGRKLSDQPFGSTWNGNAASVYCIH